MIVPIDCARAVGRDISAWTVGSLRCYDLAGEFVPLVLCGGMFKAGTTLLVDAFLK